MKIYLLKSHNPLGINSSVYSFGNFFLISSLSLKLLFVSWLFFFFFFAGGGGGCLNSENVRNHVTSMVVAKILNDFFVW